MRTDSIKAISLGLSDDNNLQGAWSLAQQLPAGSDQQTTENQIIQQYGQTDPAGTINFLEGLPTPLANSQSLLTNIATNFAQNSPADAIAEAGNLPEGPERDTYISGVFNSLLDSSPQEAESLISSLPPDKQAAAADQVTYSLAIVDPAAALAWMSSLPDGVTSAGSLTQLVTSWTQSDYAAASQWIQTLPAGTMQDTAIQSYVDMLTRFNPAAAAPLALATSNPDMRNANIVTVAQAWLSKDPTAATTWLAQTGLTADQQQQILNAPPLPAQLPPSPSLGGRRGGRRGGRGPAASP